MSRIAKRVASIVDFTRLSGRFSADMAVSIANDILETRPLPPEFSRLGPALIRQAAMLSPFRRETVRLAADINKQTDNPTFGAWLDTALTLTRREPVPNNIPFPAPATATTDDYAAFLDAQKANGKRLTLLRQLWRQGKKEALLKAIDIMTASRSGLLAGPIMAWAAYDADEPHLAEMILAEGVENFLGDNLRTRMALDGGQPDLAMTHCIRSLDREPYQPGIIELLAELAEPPRLLMPGPDTHIWLHGWSAPDRLMHTVKTLADSDTGQARVTVLNNGMACTPEELEHRMAHCAPHLKATFIHLPTYVGMPAGRNWMLARPETDQARYVACVDQGAQLPKSWLTQLLAQLEKSPQGVAAVPKSIDRATNVIRAIPRALQEFEERTIRFTPDNSTLEDMGQFDVVRPVLTVAGCCRLYHMELLRALDVPQFDVRFTPYHRAETEHDLQIWKAGGHVIFDGTVMVGCRDTRVAHGTDQNRANHHKMEAKFPQDEIEAIATTTRAADARHFRKALESVVPTLPGPAKNFWKMIGDCLDQT